MARQRDKTFSLLWNITGSKRRLDKHLSVVLREAVYHKPVPCNYHTQHAMFKHKRHWLYGES